MPDTSQRSILADLLRTVEISLQAHRESLNGFDQEYPRHGDHIIAIFQDAKQAAEEQQEASLAEALDHAGLSLQNNPDDILAMLYGLGLCQIANQFQKRSISFDELISFTRRQLSPDTENEVGLSAVRSGEIFKALAVGLVSWNRAAEGNSQTGSLLGVGDLFELGIAYEQSKQENEDRSAVLAQAAVSVSPLKTKAVYKLSGKIAFEALLRAISDQAGNTA